MKIDGSVPDFGKYPNGLMPAIIQDGQTSRVLMLGFMDAAALEKTTATGRVTFYSRSKDRLWTKGESSGNFLIVNEIFIDCDRDTLLVKAQPSGPVCHSGSDTCFDESNDRSGFLYDLERLIRDRRSNPKEGSYTTDLFKQGLDKIAQKVGEEAVELVIEAKNDDEDRFRSETADLIYHLIVLLTQKDITLTSVVDVLESRSRR